MAKAAVMRAWQWHLEQERQAQEKSEPIADEERNRQIVGLIREGNVKVVLQPKMSHDGDILGFEALSRLMEGDRSLAPSEFIPSLKGSDLEEFEWTVLRRSLVLCSREELSLTEGLKVGINVSPSTLAAPNFVARLQGLAEELGAFKALSMVRLEILESEPILMRDALGKTMHDCMSLGVDFSLDDFCAGKSEPRDLRDFNVAEVKVDRAMVWRLSDPDAKEEAKAMIRGMVEWAQARGAAVTAEGVETQEQSSELRDLGVKAQQGFLWDKPLDPDEALSRLAKRREALGTGMKKEPQGPSR